jgi:DNA-binding transcriptional LysR family regulator
MELRHLRYFLTVVEERSFRRAAERLHVAHPALSRQIHDLEDELGLKLLQRNSRGVELTEVGRGFLRGAQRTLASAQRAITEAREVAAGTRGRLSIGTIAPLTQAFLPEALARFRDLVPLVEVTVLHMNNRAQFEALLNDSIMLGITYLDPGLEEGDREHLTAKLLLRSEFCLICSKQRWPATHGRPKLADFRDDPFLAFLPEVGGDYQHLLEATCRREGGFEPKVLAVGNSLESLLSMVAAGRGVFLSPQIAMRDGAPAVQWHVLADAKGRFELFVIRKKDGEPVAAMNNFVKILFESVQRVKAAIRRQERRHERSST